MDIFKHLDKRAHVMKYDNDRIPPEERIDDLLYKTWKVTPSKNNFMPYHCNVLGPDKKDEKISIWKKCVSNKKEINEDKIPKHYSQEQGDIWKEDGFNPYFEHINSAPYLLVFTQRVCKPNEFLKECISRGDFYEQMHEEYIPELLRTACVEVGMFMANLGALALEQGLNTSTIICFPYHSKTWTKGWEDIPWVKYPVILLGSIGYKEQLRREHMSDYSSKQDKKPEKETVIQWR